MSRRSPIACAATAAALLLNIQVHAPAAAAEALPVGLWELTDHLSGQVKALVRITESDDTLQGRTEQIFSPPAKEANPICVKCEGERKGQPVIGMTILWAMKQKARNEWSGGQIIDSSNGKSLPCAITVLEDGHKLQVRSYFGVFYRTQIWSRRE